MRKFKKITTKKQLRLLLVIVFLFSASVAAAQNKVVVIPLFDDPKSESVKVYDSSVPPQYLGIYVGSSPGAGLMYNAIFIPSLNLFVIIEDTCGSPEYGHVKREGYNLDGTAKIVVSAKQRLRRLCDGTYVTGIGDFELVGNVGYYDMDCNYKEYNEPIESCRFQTKVVSPSEIPFRLPVTMPLKYEYK